jgi:CheY-like chemotaxis protein
MKPTQDTSRHADTHEGDCAVDLGDTAAACCAPHSKVTSALRRVGPLQSPRLLLACQDESVRQVLLPLFESVGTISVQEATDGPTLESLLTKEGPYNLVISQAALPGARGLEVLTRARERGDQTPFILVQSVHENFVRITIGGGQHSIVSTRLVNVVALVDLVRQILCSDSPRRQPT